MELNPNHKVVVQARDQWHKIAAAIMIATGKTEVAIGKKELDTLCAGNVNIVLDATEEKTGGPLKVRLVDDETADELARKEGGRAIDS